MEPLLADSDLLVKDLLNNNLNGAAVKTKRRNSVCHRSQAIGGGAKWR